MSRQRYLRCLYALVRRWTLCQASNSDAESCFNPLLLGLGADELMIPVARSPRTFHGMILAYRLVNDPRTARDLRNRAYAWTPVPVPHIAMRRSSVRGCMFGAVRARIPVCLM